MRAIRIARLGGVDVRLHPLMLILVAVVALNSAMGEGGGFWADLGWLVVVFSSVLVHELAHSLVARRLGVPVHGITLLPIGGVSEMKQLPERPRDELVIAAVGPLTSIGIGLVAAAVILLAGGGLLPVDLIEGPLLRRAMWMNILLAGFNLLPAFPLDGGRVLRAVLALRWPLDRATRVAARVGRGLAVGMIAIGVTFNVWLVVIGVFVFFGASAEEVATKVHVRFHGHRVAEVMVREPMCLAGSRPADDAPRRCTEPHNASSPSCRSWAATSAWCRPGGWLSRPQDRPSPAAPWKRLPCRPTTTSRTRSAGWLRPGRRRRPCWTGRRSSGCCGWTTWPGCSKTLGRSSAGGVEGQADHHDHHPRCSAVAARWR